MKDQLTREIPGSGAMTRRQLIAGGLGAAGVLAVQAAASAQPMRAAVAGESQAQDGTPFELGVEWDDEYDVVIVGYGGAGAAAAIAAADAGARVLVVEKAPAGAAGGNTRLSGGTVLNVVDRDLAYWHFLALAGADDGWEVDEDLVREMVDLNAGVRDRLAELGMDASTNLDETYVEWPEYPGGEGHECFALEGADFNSAYWRLLKGNVEARSDAVSVWCGAQATHLVQDGETGVVHGVEVSVEGFDLLVRATNGVVLACGGYENNPAMQQQFNYTARAYPIGTPYNTGDGIRMAQEVGADLWHMSCWACPSLNFVNPQTGLAAGTEIVDTSGFFGGGASGFAAQPMIVVADDGERFINEKGAMNHGHADFHGTKRNVAVPASSWCVFDETARLGCRVYSSWSDGAEEEIEKGWVLSADTVEELAGLCGIDAEGLRETVAAYNGYCADGIDPDFGSDPEFLKPLETPPFYALPLHPCVYNTYGGPRRDGACRVLAVSGDPIPHLYGAGECGSFWGYLYQGGGNLSETLYSGTAAGEGAAQAKSDVTQASAMEGREPTYVPAAQVDYEAGLSSDEAVGRGSGIGGDIVVKVTFSGDAIASVEVLEENETEGVGSRAIEQMPAEMVGLSTAEEVEAVDGVAGATLSSTGIRQAVEDALSNR